MEKSDRPGEESGRGERVAKALARAGVASRREVERMIAEGRVAVAGQVLTSPAVLVHGVEGITVDGRPVESAQATRLWRHHKPFGLVTTHGDPQGRPTVFSRLPPDLPRVLSVGRLDQNTEGLLLLTNDGDFSRWLSLPATGLPRTYNVRAQGFVDDARLAALTRGMTLDGVHYGSMNARWLPEPRGPGSQGRWLELTITEGKNREVRHVMKHLGLSILQLVRVSFGPIRLGILPPGAVEEVPAATLAPLLTAYRSRPR